MFSKETYIQRRERLTREAGPGVLLFLGNEESPMNYKANIYPFRQDSSFLYFFGLDSPGLAAVIDGDENKTVLFGDDITVEDIVWMGPQPALQDRALQVGIEHTAPSSALAGTLKAAKALGREVHLLPPYRPENILKIQSLLGIPAEEVLTGVSKPFVQAVVAQRSIKSDEEVVEIEKSLDISYDMHVTAMKIAKPGMKEQDIYGAVEGLVLARGAKTSFPIILTVHGETLHNPYHGNVLEEKHMVLHDSGAESALNYCSDITRTFPASGRFTPEQRDVYRIVLDSQEQAIRAVRPGVPFKDIHILAGRVLAAGLKDLGLMKGNVDDAVESGAHALFFQCGLGHMMGLDVHDMEDLGEEYVGYDETVSRSPQFGLDHLRLAKKLQPRYVVTVEPGVYIIPELIDMWKSENRHADFIAYDKLEAWKSFGGIRLEDDVLVTDKGFRVLGKPIPKTLDDVEAMSSS